MCTEKGFFKLFLYYFSFNCAVIHETELLCFSVRDDKGFLSISSMCGIKKNKVLFHSVWMVWTMNRESVQTKSWLMGWRVGCMQGREAVMSVLNYCEQSMTSWHGFIDALIEECILRAKLTWTEKTNPAITTNRLLGCKQCYFELWKYMILCNVFFL